MYPATVSARQLKVLYQAHLQQSLDQFTASQLSAPHLNHAQASLGYARLYALIAENPERRSVARLEQVLDEKPVTVRDREAVLDIVASHAQQRGPSTRTTFGWC